MPSPAPVPPRSPRPNPPGPRCGKGAAPRLVIHEIDDLGEDAASGVEKVRMLAGDAFVPIAEGFPAASVGRGPKDVAFARENEVRVNGEGEIDQARLQKVDRPAGVNGPENSFVLQGSDAFHAVSIQHGIAPMSDEGAVEVGAEQADFLGMSGC